MQLKFSLEDFDRIILFMIFVFFIFPLPRIPFGLKGWINIEAYLEILLLILCFFRYLLFRKNNEIATYKILVYFSSICLTYLLYAWFFKGNYFDSSLHLFHFLPFMISLLILESGTSLLTEQILFWYIISSGLSAFLSIYINFINNSFLYASYPDQIEWIDSSLRWGRLLWKNYYSAFFVVLGLFAYNYKNTAKKYLFLTFSLLCLAALILSFNRTAIFATALYIILILPFTKLKKIKLYFAPIFIIIPIVLFISNQHVNQVSHLFYDRVIGTVTGTKDISGDIKRRTVFVEQYLERINNSMPLGQGLGVPYAVTPNISFWSDITFFSFALPFGINGILVLMIFGYVILKNIYISNAPGSFKMYFYTLFLITFIVSFNDDIWSHKPFVFIFVLVIKSLQNYGTSSYD